MNNPNKNKRNKSFNNITRNSIDNIKLNKLSFDNLNDNKYTSRSSILNIDKFLLKEKKFLKNSSYLNNKFNSNYVNKNKNYYRSNISPIKSKYTINSEEFSLNNFKFKNISMLDLNSLETNKTNKLDYNSQANILLNFQSNSSFESKLYKLLKSIYGNNVLETSVTILKDYFSLRDNLTRGKVLIIEGQKNLKINKNETYFDTSKKESKNLHLINNLSDKPSKKFMSQNSKNTIKYKNINEPIIMFLYEGKVKLSVKKSFLINYKKPSQFLKPSKTYYNENKEKNKNLELLDKLNIKNIINKDYNMKNSYTESINITKNIDLIDITNDNILYSNYKRNLNTLRELTKSYKLNNYDKRCLIVELIKLDLNDKLDINYEKHLIERYLSNVNLLYNKNNVDNNYKNNEYDTEKKILYKSKFKQDLLRIESIKNSMYYSENLENLINKHYLKHKQDEVLHVLDLEGPCIINESEAFYDEIIDSNFKFTVTVESSFCTIFEIIKSNFINKIVNYKTNSNSFFIKSHNKKELLFESLKISAKKNVLKSFNSFLHKKRESLCKNINLMNRAFPDISNKFYSNKNEMLYVLKKEGSKLFYNRNLSDKTKISNNFKSLTNNLIINNLSIKIYSKNVHDITKNENKYKLIKNSKQNLLKKNVKDNLNISNKYNKKPTNIFNLYHCIKKEKNFIIPTSSIYNNRSKSVYVNMKILVNDIIKNN